MYEKSIQALVRQDLLNRERLGQQRYGTSLFPNNGRNALVDAYQEALDLAVYLRQRLAEEGVHVSQITDQPAPVGGHALGLNITPPEHRVARLHADDECGPYCNHPDDQGDFYSG